MADLAKLKKKFRKFPIRLVYPQNRIKKSRSKHNTRPDKPNSISFPMSATVKTKTGTESWRYAENKITGTDGRTIWSPYNLILRGTRLLLDTDIELVYWLQYCCPFLEGGDNFNGKVSKCIFEDLVGDAFKKAKKEEALADVKALIYSTKLGLGEDRLRKIAKAYFITDVDELSLPQVKLAVESVINTDKREGISKFLKLVDAKQALDVRASLQQAVDEKIIIYTVPKKTWAWVTEHGKKNLPFAEIGASKDPYEALYAYYLGNRKFAQEIAAALKGQSFVPAEGAEEPVLDATPE
ncbi:MAG: hypothetical protein DRQ42_02410 [Gammaproteobacteria bacterium]|nr:MAG: hypothetical protein DRQ42_02410 [Gammaproteobacteria bacterium]